MFPETLRVARYLGAESRGVEPALAGNEWRKSSMVGQNEKANWTSERKVRQVTPSLFVAFNLALTVLAQMKSANFTHRPFKISTRH